MRIRWLVTCAVLVGLLPPAAAQMLVSGIEAAPPTDLPPLLPVPSESPPVPPRAAGPRADYDPGYQYLPDQAPPGGKLPPCPCRPLGRWWVSPTLELGWSPTTPAPSLLRLVIPNGGGSTAGPILPLGPQTGTQFRVGMGLNAGVWLDRCQTNGVDGGFYFLGTENQTVTGSTPGMVVFFPDGPSRGEPAFLRVPDPAAFTGTVPVTTSNWFATADVNYRRTLTCEDAYRLDALFGYRHGYVIDEVYLGDPRSDDLHDHRVNRLAASNAFNGGQLGLAGEYRFDGGWYINGTAKSAFGVVHTDVIAGGAFGNLQMGTAAGFAPVPVPAGTSSRFGVMPSLNVAVGRQIGDRGRVFAGYNFLYLNRTARLGDLFDPSAILRVTDFWVQSVSLGMELRF